MCFIREMKTVAITKEKVIEGKEDISSSVVDDVPLLRRIFNRNAPQEEKRRNTRRS